MIVSKNNRVRITYTIGSSIAPWGYISIISNSCHEFNHPKLSETHPPWNANLSSLFSTRYKLHIFHIQTEGFYMITGYRDFYYNVTDMNRAIKFYTEAIGMKKTYGHEYWTTMTVGNLNLGLHWTEGESIPLTPRDSHGQNNGGTLTFHSDNIAEDRTKIEQAGGKILGEADEAWGHMLAFEDLDGNVLKLMNPKY